MKVKFLAFSFTVFLFFIVGCPGKPINPSELMKADTVVYKFQDSSVPPEYHRSYTINVTKSKANIVVDSYGDIISKKDVELKEGQFEEVLEAVKSSEIKISSSKSNDHGCSGGTSEYLDIFVDKKKIIDGGVYHCGKEDYGNMSGDLDILSDKLKSLFPDFQKLLKR